MALTMDRCVHPDCKGIEHNALYRVNPKGIPSLMACKTHRVEMRKLHGGEPFSEEVDEIVGLINKENYFD